ncbi:MAG: Lrp/AsnC ligand binding domain-containing protein, partial [Candidatus Diapherotrites archaeon]|nr:Lrp/AsnC ligand binding domain-containing protein [Candidatus Diapherotrites archaeon]
LSKKLEISIDTAKYRMKKLIEKKILVGFWPSVNISRLGFQWHILFIRLRNAPKSKIDELGKYLKNNKFIVKAYTTLGPWDMIIELIVHDTAHFTQILDEIKEKFCEIIHDHESLLVLQEIYYTHFVKEYYKIVE